MGDERSLVLSMLQQGRITNEEAVRLLSAIDAASLNEKEKQNSSLSNTVNDTLEMFNKKSSSISQELLKNFSVINDKLQEGKQPLNMDKLNNDFKDLQANLSTMIADIMKNINLNSDTISSVLASKTSEINKSINEKDAAGSTKFTKSIDELQSSFKGIPLDTSRLSEIMNTINAAAPTVNTYVKQYRKDILNSVPEVLEFENFNGSISIEAHDEMVIECLVSFKAMENRANDIIILTDENKNYGIKIKSTPQAAINMDIKLPRISFGKIYTSISNTKVHISDLLCTNLICTASSGKIYLSDITCDDVQASSGSGKIELANVKSGKLLVSTRNSPIAIDSTLCSASDITNSDGNITIELPDDIKGKNTIKLSTSNGKISVESPFPQDTGICINACSINGSIVMDSLTGLIYTVNATDKNGDSRIECQTPGFENAEKSIMITAQTSNSSIDFKFR